MLDHAIIDAPVWIGAHWDRDQWRLPSKEILDAFCEGKIRTVHVTDYVIVETINFLLRKGNSEVVQEALGVFLSARVRIRYVDELFFARICEIFSKYPALSLTDCSLIALAEELQLKTIFSFDTGFDRVSGLVRKEQIGK